MLLIALAIQSTIFAINIALGIKNAQQGQPAWVYFGCAAVIFPMVIMSAVFAAKG